MSSVDCLSKLRQEAEALKKSSEVPWFVEKNKEDLYAILWGIPETCTTKQALIELLEDAYTWYSLDLQRKKQTKLLSNETLVRPTQVLDWTRRAYMAKQNYLPCVMQSAFSLPEDYVVVPRDKKLAHAKYIDALAIIPDTIPQSFLQVFDIDHIDDDAQNIKELFKKAQPLQYHKEKATKTWRIVTIDGKLVIFRTLEQLLEDKKPYTTWSKRRYATKKYMNAFDNVYSAIRSQYHSVDSETDKIDTYKDVQKNIVALVQELAWEYKDYAVRRQIDQAIEAIGKATSFPIMASKVYHLFEFAFNNRWIASKQLLWVENKLSKELLKLRSTVLEIQSQTDALEKYTYAQEHTIELFHSHVKKAIYTRDAQWLSLAFDTYVRTFWTSIQATEPFVNFDRDIRELMLTMKKKQSNHQLFLKAELLVTFQSLLLHSYKLEHKIKTWIVKANDFCFDTKIFTKYPHLYTNFFQNIAQSLHTLSRTSATFKDNNEKIAYCNRLKQFRKLSNRQENIAALKQL